MKVLPSGIALLPLLLFIALFFGAGVYFTWAGEPNYENRIRTGLKAMLFLVAFTLIAYAAKRKIWAKIH